MGKTDVRKRGRPYTEKRFHNPAVGSMVVTRELKDLLVSQRKEDESLADCALRLIRNMATQLDMFQK